MFTQEYGDRNMWPTILLTLGSLAATALSNKLAKQQGESSKEYNTAFSGANDSIEKQKELAEQYAGNKGYENSLEQGAKGAGLIANQAAGTATSAARNQGMSKAQAAQMGVQTANQNYANALQGQQQTAASMGQNAMTAQGNVTGALQGQSGQAASETQAKYNRKADTMGRMGTAISGATKAIGDVIGNGQ